MKLSLRRVAKKPMTDLFRGRKRLCGLLFIFAVYASVVFRAIVGDGVGTFESKSLKLKPKLFTRFRNARDRFIFISILAIIIISEISTVNAFATPSS